MEQIELDEYFQISETAKYIVTILYKGEPFELIMSVISDSVGSNPKKIKAKWRSTNDKIPKELKKAKEQVIELFEDSYYKNTTPSDMKDSNKRKSTTKSKLKPGQMKVDKSLL